jgi:hypothetical protein
LRRAGTDRAADSAGLRYLIRIAQLQPYGESRVEARERGERLAALLEQAEELGMEV